MGWACASCGGGNPEGTRFCGHCGTRRGDLGRRVDERVEGAIGAFLEARAEDSKAESAAQERRLVTAVFADLSGFTALADQVDEELLSQVVDPLISRFAAVVAKYEGYISKYAGDAVLALFGAPIAHEDDASRALRAALEMRDALQEMRPSLPEAASHVELHVGVNTGHVVARAFGNQIRPDYSVLGDAINVAQRLEASASAGEIYVGASTHALTAHSFEFEELRSLRVKGKSEEVHAYLLRSQRSAQQSRSPRVRSSALVGRQMEMAAVVDLLSRVDQGRGGVVSVLGEPGVGKSRLLEEIGAQVSDPGLWWLDTRCLSYGAALAYWPFVELLRRSFGVQVDKPPAEATRALAASLAIAGVPDAEPYFSRLLGLPSPQGALLADLQPEALKRGLHEAFVSWLDSLASMQPVVLVVEDIHWVDASSAELLREVAQLTRRRRVVVVVTGRPEAAAEAEAIVLGTTEPGRIRIRLGPLGAGEVGDLVEDLVGAPAATDLVQGVLDRTGGNPFFVEEVVRTLDHQGALQRDAVPVALGRGWDLAQVPATVEGVLASRIDALPPAAAHVLQVASVIGARVRQPLLAAVAGGVVDLDRQLDLLASSGFLDGRPADGEYSFVFHHALVQDVAYQRMLRRQRRRIHLRTAEAAERLYGAGDDSIDLLARHYYLGEAGPRAVYYLEKAGNRARRLFANETALVHLDRAVEVARTESALADRVPELMLAVADVLEITGDYERSDTVYREVRDTTGDMRAWRGLAALRRKTGQFADALAQLELALTDPRMAGRDTSALWLERAWTLGAEGRRLEAIEAAEAGLRDPAADPITVGRLLTVLGLAEATIGRLDAAVQHGTRAEQILTEMGDLLSLAAVERALGDIRTLAGDLDGAAEALHRGTELAQRTGDAAERAACLVNLGMLELKRGNLEQAIAYDRMAVEQAERIGHRAGQAITYTNLSEKLLIKGELEEATEWSERAVSLAEELGAVWTLADARMTMARIHHYRGQVASAVTLARSAADLFRQAGSPERAEQAEAVALDAEGLRTTSRLPDTARR